MKVIERSINLARLKLWHGVNVTGALKGPDLLNNSALSALSTTNTEVDIAKVNASNVVELPNSAQVGASGTATATAGAATLNADSGKVTSESLTTAADTDYTLTITNSKIAATSKVVASVANGTNSQGAPVVTLVTPGAGSLVIVVRNVNASQALNGTLVVTFVAFK